MTEGRRYRGMLIANAEFPRDPHALPGLRGPLVDIGLIHEALTDRTIGLFDPADVARLENEPVQVLRERLDEFFESAESGDVLLLYYSGHGKLNLENQLHLCAKDSRTDRLRSTTLSSTDLNHMIDDSAADAVIIVLDCCHSGAFRGGDLAQSVSGRGRYVITSARASQLALDETGPGEPSPFTDVFVRALRKAEAAELLTVSALYKHVYSSFGSMGGQIPQIRYVGEGELAIARRGAPPALDAEPREDVVKAPRRFYPEATPLIRTLLDDAATAVLAERVSYRVSNELFELVRVWGTMEPERAIQFLMSYPEQESFTMSRAREQLARALALRDLAAAERFGYLLIESERESGAALLALAEELAAFDLDRAVDFVRAMPGEFERGAGLARVAAAAIERSDPRREALFEEAELSASMIPQVYRRLIVVTDLARAAARFDLERSITMLTEAERDGRREMQRTGDAAGLGLVTAAFAASDPDRAEGLAYEIIQTATDPDSGLERAVAALAGVDPDRAGRVIGAWPGMRSSKLMRIAKAVASDAPDLAERLVLRVDDDEYGKARTQLDLVEVLIPTNLVKAEQSARAIEDERRKIEALGSVAQALAPNDPRRAERICQEIIEFDADSPRYQVAALTGVGRALVPAEITRAKAMLTRAMKLASAELRFDESGHVAALAEIGRTYWLAEPAHGLHLLKEAEQLAVSGSRTPDWRQVSEVAKAMAAANPERAERLARTIPDEFALGRASALLSIAEVRYEVLRDDATGSLGSP